MHNVKTGQIRESGCIFAGPTYFFIVTVLTLVGVGGWRAATRTIDPVPPADALQPTGQALTLFLLLTAFSNGCTAMTGVEAVSNGVPAFRPPESKNAATTMLLTFRAWPPFSPAIVTCRGSS